MVHRIIPDTTNMQHMRTILLVLRLLNLVVLVALMTMHIRLLRVFRWEQSMSGGVIITYSVAALGLALCANNDDGDGIVFQAYICATGAALLAINAAGIYRRWSRAGELTRVVAEFLVALGVPVKRQLMAKVALSAIAATMLLIDLALTTLWEDNAMLSEEER